MFPLGSVLMPGAALPLRIFEPRYQVMLDRVLAGDRRLAVVLIERGQEVGGQDVRSSVGTLAIVEEHQPLGNGQHAVLIRGIERIKVESWLPDDPYPQAKTVKWPDPVPSQEAAAKTGQLETAVESSLRQLLARASEMGYAVPPSTFEPPKAVDNKSFILAALSPLGPFDQQRLLETETEQERLEKLGTLIKEQLALLDL